MSSSRHNIERIFADVECVAAAVAASDVFSLIARRLDLPPQWAARVATDGADARVFAPGTIVDGSDAETVLFVRTSPVDVSLDVPSIDTGDGFLGRANVRWRVAMIPERGELDAFQEKVLGSQARVDTRALARHFEPGVARACTVFAARHDVDELTGGAADALRDAVTEAISAACFEAGLRLVDTPRVRFESEAFRRVRIAEQDAIRRRQEHEAAGRLRDAIQSARQAHLDQLSGTLDRLRVLADESPDVDLPVLIRTFAEHERSDLYEALFATSATERHTRWVVVATAGELLYFEPDHPDEPVRRVPIEGPAGALRSVQWVRSPDPAGRLLLGAATGVYVHSPEASTPDACHVVPDAPPVRGGFNAAAWHDGQLLATHSELGVYRWRGAEPGGAEPDPGEPLFASMTRRASAVRGVRVHGDHAYCGVDDRVIAWPVDGPCDTPAQVYTGSAATITTVCPSDAGLFAGNADGQVLHWRDARQARPDVIHHGGRRGVESVWVVPAGGVRRLIYTDTSLCVYARVLGDTFTCRYEASGQTLRRVEVAPDLILATNDLRDRLLHFTPGKPQRPTGLTQIGRLTGHAVQDVCLVPRA